MRKLLPAIGWLTLSPEEAMDHGFDQAGRWTWQIWRIEWFGVGVSLLNRAI